jgi:hypothetical protein
MHAQFMFWLVVAQALRQLTALALPKTPRYSAIVAANSATGFGHPIKLAHKRPRNTKAGAFFVPAISSYGGCAWEGFGPAGCQLSRLTNLRTAATHSLGHERGSSKHQVGAPPMKYLHALNPSKFRAAAHRRMAFAALHADSSLHTRLTRYQHHMSKARALEAAGGAA